VSVPVPLGELAQVLDRRGKWVYLLTVGDDQRTHCVASPLEWVGRELVVQAGTTSRHNASARGTAVLLSPPRVAPLGTAPLAGGELVGGALVDEALVDEALDAYSLIVDAEVVQTGGTESRARTVRMRPVHAVLHRPAPAHGDGRSHDCVHLYGTDGDTDTGGETDGDCNSDSTNGSDACDDARSQGSAGPDGGRRPRSRST
jgi:hypothetical protein